ncbi:MAG TPA: pimeloyl-CoA dehydrogenase large subunit, partial [Halieaceae bacterium]|nr:pimeloyl-CoA dehydrogenase large subunit [Halieaceae bacterium]
VLPNDLTAEQLGHDFGSQARQTYMYGRASTIYGGSNEVQKNIIAKAVLGL